MKTILIAILAVLSVVLVGVSAYQRSNQPAEPMPIVINQPAVNQPIVKQPVVNQPTTSQPSTSCGKEGAIFYNPDDVRNICCAGLQGVYSQDVYYTDDQGDTCAIGATPRNVVCVACGNGVCGAGESKCNCPQDCK
ncbi:MAG: hypothetical protein V1819_00680 [bacterium]